MAKVTLYGVHLSPYVRKVRLALAFKGIEYEHIPVIPFGPDQPPEFTQNSPLGKVPLLKADDTWLPDSSVICGWAQREVPVPSLFPTDNLLAARASWYEEYADSHMVAVIGGHLFAEIVLAPAIFKREPIQADIDKAIGTEIPGIFDYLEGELTGDYLVGDSLSLADISVCGVFVSMHHCQHQCDAARWPKTSAYIDRIHNAELFTKLIEEEKQMMAMFS